MRRRSAAAHDDSTTYQSCDVQAVDAALIPILYALPESARVWVRQMIVALACAWGVVAPAATPPPKTPPARVLRFPQARSRVPCARKIAPASALALPQPGA
jgi:hypothetical protein